MRKSFATDGGFLYNNNAKDQGKKKRKGSSSDDEGEEANEDPTMENAQYFINEEKVLKNHLRLNFGLYYAHIALVLVSVILFDWTHVVVHSTSGSITAYHISLTHVHFEGVNLKPEWLYVITDDCLV